MRRPLPAFVSIGLCGLAAAAGGQSLALPADAPAAIRREGLFAHVELLASDELQGRAAGCQGAMVASRYVAVRFRHAGLACAPGLDSFDQRIEGMLVKAEEASTLEVRRGGVTVPLRFHREFAELSRATGRAAAGGGPAVFCGFGIHAPGLGYDDYKGLAPDGLAGKIAVIVLGGPRAGREDDPFKAIRWPLYPGLEQHLNQEDKVREAARRGAVAVILVPDILHGSSPDPVAGSRLSATLMPFLAETFTAEALFPPAERAHGTPAFLVGKQGIEALFGSADALKERLVKIDTSLAPEVAALTTEVKFDLKVSVQPAPAANVVGWLEGRDETLKKELVIVSAHLDGIGPTLKPGLVNRGADDDASGTAAMIEVARVLAACGRRPRRSVAFIGFTGEERGLIGSSYYVARPVFPLASTVAVVQMDMVSRNDPGSVYVVNGGCSARLRDALVTGLREEGLATKFDMEGFRRGSDHWPFAERGIPAVLVFTGLHKELHTPADSAESVDAAKMERIARGVLRAVWELAENGVK